MAQIKSYKFTPRSINVYSEIWDEEKRQLKAIKDMESFSIHEVLDSIVLAVEAGVIDSYIWPQQLFASRKAFENFIEQLSEYDDCYRITDQWWLALASLAEVVDEEAFVSSREIADKLFDTASEEGRMENFGRKKPKYLYTTEECTVATLLTIKSQASWDKFLTEDDRRKNAAISAFGRHYKLDISDEAVRQAQEEGDAMRKAILKAEKKVPTKKALKKMIAEK